MASPSLHSWKVAKPQDSKQPACSLSVFHTAPPFSSGGSGLEFYTTCRTGSCKVQKKFYWKSLEYILKYNPIFPNKAGWRKGLRHLQADGWSQACLRCSSQSRAHTSDWTGLRGKGRP